MMKRFSKSDWYYLLDGLLLISAAGVIVLGILLGFVIAEGPTVAAAEKYFLGLHRHQWGEIHRYLSLAFVALLILHLILHWSWIKGKSSKVLGKRWGTILISAATLSVFAVLLVAWILEYQKQEAYADYDTRNGGRGMRQDAAVAGVAGNSVVVGRGRQTLNAQQEPASARSGRAAGDRSAVNARIPSRRQSNEAAVMGTELSNQPRMRGQSARFPVSEAERGRGNRGLTNESAPCPEGWESHPENGAGSENARPSLSEDLPITGQWTLADIQEHSGVPATIIARYLELPVHVSVDGQLGRIRRQTGLSMNYMRQKIYECLEEYRKRAEE